MTYVCSPRRFVYKGITIEQSGIGGPWPCNKAGDPYQRVPRAVATIMDEWCKLTREEELQYRAGGGCEVFK